MSRLLRWGHERLPLPVLSIFQIFSPLYLFSSFHFPGKHTSTYASRSPALQYVSHPSASLVDRSDAPQTLHCEHTYKLWPFTSVALVTPGKNTRIDQLDRLKEVWKISNKIMESWSSLWLWISQALCPEPISLEIIIVLINPVFFYKGSINTFKEI